MRRTYPSDVSQARWQMIERLIDEPVRRGRKRTIELREVINAINYRWTTGCPWRMLPHDFPAWESVYFYFRRWQKGGQLRNIREILLRKSPYIPLGEADVMRLTDYESRRAVSHRQSCQQGTGFSRERSA